MKITKIPGFGSYGQYIDDVDFTTPIKSSHLSYYKDLIDTLKQKAIPFNIVKSYAR